MKPRLFVGSSVESLDVAYAVQENLDHDAEVTVWPEGLFQPSKTTLHQLLAVLGGFDFATFVFAPDDIVVMRDQKHSVTRDNVIFEVGLFIARLGPERCFVLVPRGLADLHLPSDLLGLTPAGYDSGRQDGNIVAGLGTPCNQIRRAMKKLGLISDSSNAKSATSQVAAGIADEVRESLKTAAAAGSKLEQTSQVEQSYRQLHETLEGLIPSLHQDQEMPLFCGESPG